MITELNCAMIGAWDGPFFEARQVYLIMLILAALPTFAYQLLQSSSFFLPSSDGALQPARLKALQVKLVRDDAWQTK